MAFNHHLDELASVCYWVLFAGLVVKVFRGAIGLVTFCSCFLAPLLGAVPLIRVYFRQRCVRLAWRGCSSSRWQETEDVTR